MKKIVLGLAMVTLVSPAFGGVVYEVETTRSAADVVGAEISVEGTLVKMDVASSRDDWDGEMIFRGDEQEMVVIDHDKKSYFVLDREQMNALADQVNQAMAQMEQALAMVPAGQRAQMEQMMKSRMPGMGTPREPAVIENTGESDTVAGYPCVKYVVKRGGRLERELWVTPWKNIEGGDHVVEAFEAMSDFMAEMLSSLPSTDGQKGFGDPTFEHLRDMKGFPVMTREFSDSGAVQWESTLKDARLADFTPADFTPPKNYKRKDFAKAMGR